MKKLFIMIFLTVCLFVFSEIPKELKDTFQSYGFAVSYTLENKCFVFVEESMLEPYRLLLSFEILSAWFEYKKKIDLPFDKIVFAFMSNNNRIVFTYDEFIGYMNLKDSISKKKYIMNFLGGM